MPDDENTEANPPLSDGEVRHLKELVQDHERRLSVVEEQEQSEPWHGGLIDTLPAMDGSPGFVVDEGVARATPCTRIDLGEGSELVYSKGVVGPLDAPQKALFCPETVDKPVSEPLRRRHQAFREASESCKGEIADLPEGERMRSWIGCISREAGKRGEQI